MDGKNINKVNVEAVEETGDETSTSLIYNPKDGKWQRPLSACDSTTLIVHYLNPILTSKYTFCIKIFTLTWTNNKHFKITKKYISLVQNIPNLTCNNFVYRLAYEYTQL